MVKDLEEQQDEVHEVLKQYFTEGKWKIEQNESGVNNTTRFIICDNQKYVLRIYENHTDVEKVNYECQVLQRLQHAGLPFRIPKPIRALDGQYHTVTASGKLSIVFEYIEGRRAELANSLHTASIGKAMGELVAALEHVDTGLVAAYEPYYDLFNIHPLVTPDKLSEWLQSMRQGVFAKDVLLLENEIEKLLKMIPILKQLPVQLVHSDIVAGNVLAKGDEVSAILDFEFVTPDLRAMDAAVFINELVKYHGDRWELLDAFIAGYSASAKLTADEIEALPQLILLRSIVLCIHFLGRQWAGVDLHDANEPYLNSFREVYDWLDHNQNQLRELCYRRFEQEVKG